MPSTEPLARRPIRIAAFLAFSLVLMAGAKDPARAVGAAPAKILPSEGTVVVLGLPIYRSDHRIGVSFTHLRMAYFRDVNVALKCRNGCPEGPATRRFVSIKEMRGEHILKKETLDIEVTRRGWIGLDIRISDAGKESFTEKVLCVLTGTHQPFQCPKARKEVIATGASPPPSSPALIPLPMSPPPDREGITSIDGTRGDRAPYSGEFSVAYQPFMALSDRVTYLGATLGNPALPVGLAPSDRMTLRLCESASCAGTELAAASPHVSNYGLTTADIGDVPVVPGETYFLVWSPPEDAHGSHWLTFWHGGTASVAGSHEPEAIVRGFRTGEGEGEGPEVARRDVVDYAGVQPPPAPYSGPFQFASQGFKAASNTITKIGVVVGNTRLARGSIGPETIALRLCESADCSTGVLATAAPFINNYGPTEADIGDVAITPGHTYFIYWQSPHKVEGTSWVSYWLGQGPEIEEARLFQAFARGYNSGGDAASVLLFPEQSGHFGSPTFSEPEHALGQGPTIAPLTFVQVSCRLYSPQIESAEPDGYWYRIHSFPWNDRYYAVANTFWNGVAPGEKAEPINTDLNVPSCTS